MCSVTVPLAGSPARVREIEGKAVRVEFVCALGRSGHRFALPLGSRIPRSTRYSTGHLCYLVLFGMCRPFCGTSATPGACRVRDRAAATPARRRERARPEPVRSSDGPAGHASPGSATCIGRSAGVLALLSPASQRRRLGGLHAPVRSMAPSSPLLRTLLVGVRGNASVRVRYFGRLCLGRRLVSHS